MSAKELRTVTIHTDGAARGNPGKAGTGIVFYDENGSVVREFGRFLGVTTNNIAEYTALLEALQEAHSMGVKQVLVRSDSELMVKQIRGEYRVKNAGLMPLFAEVRRALLRFPEWKIEHVPREKNGRADKLANKSIDESTGE